MKQIELNTVRRAKSNDPVLFALVDDDKFDYLMQWRWFAVKSRYTYYARTNKCNDYRSVRMHRLLMGAVDTEIIDHIDLNGLNNQCHNLRRCSVSQNQMNKPSYNHSSKFKGVRLHHSKSNKFADSWYAEIRINGKPIHIGTFRNEEDAAMAYDKLAKKHFGEFARLNFNIPSE